jgi:hypothetical protein
MHHRGHKFSPAASIDKNEYPEVDMMDGVDRWFRLLYTDLARTLLFPFSVLVESSSVIDNRRLASFISLRTWRPGYPELWPIKVKNGGQLTLNRYATLWYETNTFTRTELWFIFRLAFISATHTRFALRGSIYLQMYLFHLYWQGHGLLMHAPSAQSIFRSVTAASPLSWSNLAWHKLTFVQVQVPASGSETIECGVCQRPLKNHKTRDSLRVPIGKPLCCMMERIAAIERLLCTESSLPPSASVYEPFVGLLVQLCWEVL